MTSDRQQTKKQFILIEEEDVTRFAIAHLFTRWRFDSMSRRAIRFLILRTAKRAAKGEFTKQSKARE